MKILKAVRLEHNTPTCAIFVWLDEDWKVDVHMYNASPSVLLDIEDRMRELGYTRYPYGNIMNATYLHPDFAELDRIPEPGARLMWRVKNRRYLAFARNKDHAEDLRMFNSELKHGRIEEVLNLYPSKIKYGEIYEV